MSTTFTGAVQISQPVLHSATSSRVSPSLRNGRTAVYSSTEDLINQQLARKEQQLRQNGELDTSANRFQTKYASPDNLVVAPNMAQLSIASIEADALSGKSIPHTNGGGSAFSDTSSEISSDTPMPSAPPSATSVATSGTAFVIPSTDGISEQDINQVEIFYRSHKTEVRVCRSLANLYVSVPKIKDRASLALTIPEPQKIESKRSSKKSKSASEEQDKEYAPPPRSPEPADIRKDEWEFAKTGIPLLVLDSGEHLRDRRLSIVLAERGTGFTLWSDVINHLTKYSTPHTNFHTLTLSTDSTRLVGLSFDEGPAASEFAEAVTSLTANPDDDLLNLSKKKKKKKEKKSKLKYKAPKKIEISQPCCFVHVTKLERPDYLGIPLLVFPPPPSGAELRKSQDNMTRAISQSSGLSECSTTPSSDH